MKAKLIKSEQPNEFKPFKVEIECETIEDARLMFHISNMGVIGTDITSGHNQLSYCFTGSNKISQSMQGDLWAKIRAEIESQGFKI